MAGIDPAPYPRAFAARTGLLALDECGQATTEQVLAWSRGRGADAVLVCAAGSSDAAVTRVPALCRDRADVIIVGDVGLRLDRTPFYERALSLRFARSYGPGRYDPSYESWGVDYPTGHVRWTEGRNFEAVLDLLAAGRLPVEDLVTHSYDISQATQAYRLIEERTEPYLAIRLDYPDDHHHRHRGTPEETLARDAVQVRPDAVGSAGLGVGWVGAGAFSTATLLPALRAAGSAGWSRWPRRAACRRPAPRSATASRGRWPGRTRCSPTRTCPSSSSRLPMTRTPTSLSGHCAPVTMCGARSRSRSPRMSWTRCGPRGGRPGASLSPAFNRRWSPAVAAARRFLAGLTEPKLVVYRVAAGPVPAKHWYRDRRKAARCLARCATSSTPRRPLSERRSRTWREWPAATRGPGDDTVVSLRFADGSLAAIAYGSATPTAGKEWIEVHAGAHRVVIDDFRSATADGRRLWKGRQDKGHHALATDFRRAVLASGEPGGADLPTEDMLATMRATIRAAGNRGGRG